MDLEEEASRIIKSRKFKIKKVSQSIVVEEIKVIEEESFSIDTFQTSLSNFIAGVDKSYYDSIILVLE